MDLVISGAGVTVAMDGQHALNSLLVTNGAALTHSPGNPNGLRLQVQGDVTVEAGGAITADGKGFQVSQGPGAGGYRIGGSYGGVGGGGGPAYGSVTEPVDLGSGGGGSSYSPGWGSGGGLVHLTVGSILRVDGVISAGGSYNWAGGGGSGGSVNVRAGMLSGSGTISAHGAGAGDASSGGGGRIALRAGTNTFAGSVAACGGSNDNSANVGQGGTVFFQAGSTLRVDGGGCAEREGRCELSGTNSLEWANFDVEVIRGALVVDTAQTFKSLLVRTNGSVTHSAGNLNGLRLQVPGDVTVEAGGAITADGKGYPVKQGPGFGDPNAGASYGGVGGSGGRPTYGSAMEPADLGSGGSGYGYPAASLGSGGGLVHLTVGGTLQVDGAISAGGLYNYGGGGGSGGSVNVRAGVLSGSGAITAQGAYSGPAGSGGGGRIALRAGTNTFAGWVAACGGHNDNSANVGQGGTVLFQAGSTLRVNIGGCQDRDARCEINWPNPMEAADFDVEVVQGTLMVDTEQTIRNLIVRTNGSVTHSAGNPNGLRLRVLGNLTVELGGAIKATGLGYGLYQEPGAGGRDSRAGGSYGGQGGYGGKLPYGSETEPLDLGSGGAGDAGGGYRYGAGGGAIRLMVGGNCQVDGLLDASGNYHYNGGGGSGGSINLLAATFAGGGQISAVGGQSTGQGGGGGGGRIKLQYESSSFAGITSVAGGPGTLGNGGSGSLYTVQGRPPTRVWWYAPVGRNGGHLQVLEHLRLTFSREMNTSPQNAHKFSVTGPMGTFAASGVSLVAPQTYEFAFPAFATDGTHHFTLLPSFLDAGGYPMEQNANGTAGEAADGCSFDLILDTVPPRILAHSPAGDIAGTMTSVDVSFTERMDLSTFLPNTVAVSTPGGSVVAANAIQELGRNLYRISFPPQTVTGLYRMVISSNATDLAGNGLSPSYDPLTFNLVPVDLELQDVALSTNQLWCGEAVTLTWNGRNTSGAPLLGSWMDAVYFSKDDHWDINDVLLGTVVHSGGLQSNELYAASSTFFVPGAFSGDYHLIIRADVYNQEKEATGEANNVIAIPTPVFMPELTVGTPRADLFLANKHARYYQVVVPDGQDLRVALDLAAANGATELYIRREAIATRVDFDVRYTAPFQPDQVVRVPGTRAGSYCILAYSDVIPIQPTPFTMLAEFLPLTLTDSTPRFGGNAGNVTIKLMGSGIGTNSTVKLVYLGSNSVPVEIRPIRGLRTGSDQLFATFDLRGITPSIVDVVLVGDQGQTRTLPGAFQIEVGRPEPVKFRWDGPSAARKHGIPFYYTVSVRNDSNQDADLVNVSCWVTNHPGVGLTLQKLASPQKPVAASMGYVSDITPKLLVGEEVNLYYEVRVQDSFPDGGVQMIWDAQTTDRSAFFADLARQVESWRLAVLSSTNLQVGAPWLYSLALDPPAWRNREARLYQSVGYDVTADDLIPSLVGRTQKDPGWMCTSGCMTSCPKHCEGCDDSCILDCNNWCKDHAVYPNCTPPTPPTPCRAPTKGVASKDSGGCGFGPSATTFTEVSDPNAKTAMSGVGFSGFVSVEPALNYLIQFENQPTATAAAVRVSVEDGLAHTLDWTTVELKEIGFAGMRITVPAGMSHYEGRLPFSGWTWNPTAGWHRGETPLMVEVKAGVNIETGLLSVEISGADTNTGVIPADPFAGFLPPNRPETFYFATNCVSCGGSGTVEWVQPGQGYLTYSVRPKTNLASGTVITNGARIIFDWNDPIDTPTAFNAIDAGAPVSSVLPLPSLSGRTFEVQWGGTDEFGGSGVANYDVYVSSDGTNYSRWLDRTTETRAWCVGQLGRPYYFYSVARDWVGHEQTGSQVAQAYTTIPTNAPVLSAMTNSSILPGSALAVTNAVHGTPAGQWLFSLGAGAPSGASVNPTNGVFRWTPTCAQATTTNTITVWVTDSGRTNLMDAMNFTVVVRECVQPTLGQQVLLAGQSGRVPVWLISSVPLTNLSMTLVAPTERLTSYSLEKLVSQICTNTIAPLSNGLHRLNFAACPGQSLIGTQQVAWLNFATVSNQSSAFVRLEFTDLVGRMTDGTLVANFAPQAGRLVIIGEEPLLECVIGTNGWPALILYGKPGWNCDVDARPTLTPTTPWQFHQRVTLPDMFQTFDLVPAPSNSRFFRALRN